MFDPTPPPKTLPFFGMLTTIPPMHSFFWMSGNTVATLLLRREVMVRWQSRKTKEFGQFCELLDSLILAKTNLKTSGYMK